MIARRLTALTACLILMSCTRSGLEATVDDSQIKVMDGDQPVLTYQLRPEAGAEPWRANYLHPLYAPSGTLITENAPADHVHHRGLFWAWRGVFVNGESAGDAWVGDHIRFENRSATTETLDRRAIRLTTETLWSTDTFGEQLDFMREIATVTVWKDSNDHRRIDLQVALRALVPGVTLAGSDNEKGYGGLSFRFGHADVVGLASGGEALTATPTPVKTGETVAFLDPKVSQPGWPAEIAISCSVNGEPWYNWILRQEPSMQNCAWPGREAAAIAMDRDTVLEASLTID